MKQTLQYWKDYLWSLSEGRRRKETFGTIQSYSMFIGYPRSGHTLHGSLLNAHPEMVIAHELDALSYVERGISRNQLFALILRRDRWFQDTKNSQWYKFNYRVPNQSQGSFRQLKVIGDKKGGGSSTRLQQSPGLLLQLRKIVQLPMKVIHVVRNPFDNIATMSRRSKIPLEEATRLYLDLAETNARQLQSLAAGESITIRHEDMIANPRDTLKRMVQFVGLQADDAYLSDCASVVFASPSRSRGSVQWDDRLKASIQAGIEKHAFLQGYTIES